MAVEDLLKGSSKGVLVGLGLAAAAPLLFAGITKGSRPVAKAMINSYLDLADKLKEMGGETLEEWHDLLAEVHAEREGRKAMALSNEEVPQTS